MPSNDHNIPMSLIIQFDLEVSDMGTNPNNPNHDLYQTDCWNSSLSLRIENALSDTFFNRIYTERVTMNESSYGGSDAMSWLLSLGQSLLLSLVLWQPLTYVLYFHLISFCNSLIH